MLFLFGRAGLEHAEVGRVSRARIIGLLVLVGSAPVMRLVPLLAVACTVTAVLAGIAIADAVSARRHGTDGAPGSRAG